VAKQAVQYFVPDHPGSLRKAAARIQSAIDDNRLQLSGGYATDWADYKRRVGFLAGMEHAIAMLAESEKENSGG
jgi:hypothetical protein